MRRSFPVLLSALVTAELVCSLESNMIFLAISHLYRLYGDPVHVGWLITIFTLTAGAASAVCGRLGDLYGRKRMLLLMLGVACAGSTISALSDDLNIIILGRALQGVSMAVLPLCFGIIREHAPEERIPFAVGILGGTYTMGVALGSVTGGYIIDNFEWQVIFYLSAALAIVSLLCVAWIVPASQPVSGPATENDFLGGVLFVPGLIAVLLSVSQGARWGWFSAPTLCLLLGGAALIVIWVRHELRHPNPLIDIRLLQGRQIAFSNLCAFFLGVGPLVITLVLMSYMQQPPWTGTGLGLSALVAGSVKVPGNVTGGLTIIAAGALASRYGSRLMVLIGTIVTTIGWMALIFFHGSTWMVAGLYIFLMIPGTATVNAILPGLVIAATPEDRTSESTGVMQVVRSLGLAIGSQMVSLILASSMVAKPDGSGIEFPSEAAYMTMFITVAGISLVSMAMILCVPRSTTLDGARGLAVASQGGRSEQRSSAPLGGA